MAKSVKRSTYARMIGEIAIEWNILEFEMRDLGCAYLRGDMDVTDHILANLGNVSLTDFIVWLTNKLEKEPLVRGHIAHLVRMFHILRENRNILERAIPAIRRSSNRYVGTIDKPGKRGQSITFLVPINALEEMFDSLTQASAYAKAIQLFAIRDAVGIGYPTPARVQRRLSSLEKPALPRKIDPLPPPEGQRAVSPRLPPYPA